MKIRYGFVTNSSSSSFVIQNNTGEDLTLSDLANEMQEVFAFYLEHEAYWNDHEDKTFNDLLESAAKYTDNRFIIPAYEQILLDCGDHDDDGLLENVIHAIDDTINTESFTVTFYESNH